jgi:predicted 3-demethylubiquinone-9 3-methyltransferase (glyoxalase superfamily)
MTRITRSSGSIHGRKEAARSYASIFKNSTIGRIAYYGEAGPGPAGTVMTEEVDYFWSQLLLG